MPRPKKRLSLADHLAKYDSEVLQKAQLELENSLFWEVLKAYFENKQRWYEVAALDLAGHSGKSQEAAKASGYAHALEDVVKNDMTELHKLLAGDSGVVESPVPEE